MNKNKPYFIMVVGLPASGKSTYCKSISEKYNAKIFSSDELRVELFGSDDDKVNTKENNQKVFETLHKRIKKSLKNGNDVIYDATNISSKRRIAFLNELKNIPCYKKCIVVATNYEECLKRNQLRDRHVPEKVIKKMYLNWNTPYYFEGWDDIKIQYTTDNTNGIYDWLHIHTFYSQDNSHHKMSLGVHSILVGDYHLNNPLLRCAGYLHDCGKPFTKSFVNSKCETTSEAHYYQHHCCGAYDLLFFDTMSEFGVSSLDVSVLVNYHMYPYFWEKDKNELKLKDKYRRLWGNKLYENVMKLHEADVVAH